MIRDSSFRTNWMGWMGGKRVSEREREREREKRSSETIICICSLSVWATNQMAKGKKRKLVCNFIVGMSSSEISSSSPYFLPFIHLELVTWLTTIVVWSQFYLNSLSSSPASSNGAGRRKTKTTTATITSNTNIANRQYELS